MDWPKVQLGAAVTILDSMRKPVKAGDRIEGPYPYYGANGQQGTINDFIFDEPLILVAEDGGHFFDPSRPIAYRIEGKTWVNNHAHVLSCNPDMDISYLCHQLARYNVQQYLTGSTRAKLTKGALERIPITKPPLEEQKRIAAILDKTNDIHRNSELGASLQNELISNVFLEMFGDPRINEKNWPTKPLIEVATLQRGFDLPVQNRVPGSVPILASNGPVGYHNEIKVNGPGVVTGRSGSLGNVQFVEQGYWPLNTSLWVKNFHGNEPQWIAHLLRHMNLQNFTRGSGVPTLNRNLVHVVDVIHPPIELQKMFAAYEISIQSTFESIISSSRKSTTLVSSITQEMLQ